MPAKKPKLSTREQIELRWIRISNLMNNLPKTVDLATNLGVAYLGAKVTKHPAGAIVGLVGLKLAQAQNLVAGISGVATLAGLGLAHVVDGGGFAIGTPLTGNTLGEDLLIKLKSLISSPPASVLP